MFKTVQLVLFTLFLGTVAQADHTLPGGSLNRLAQDTRQLYYAVNNSSISSRVKRAVYTFRYDVDSLIRCTQVQQDEAGIQKTVEKRDHDILPEHCEYYLRYVHYSWREVDRYLWDTAFDYPWIYNSYLRVRSDMSGMPH